jgi:hypothetical protein
MTKETKQKTANTLSIIYIVFIVIWLISAALTEPNAWWADLAENLSPSFLVAAMAFNFAAQLNN